MAAEIQLNHVESVLECLEHVSSIEERREIARAMGLKSTLKYWLECSDLEPRMRAEKLNARLQKLVPPTINMDMLLAIGTELTNPAPKAIVPADPERTASAPLPFPSSVSDLMATLMPKSLQFPTLEVSARSPKRIRDETAETEKPPSSKKRVTHIPWDSSKVWPLSIAPSSNAWKEKQTYSQSMMKQLRENLEAAEHVLKVLVNRTLSPRTWNGCPKSGSNGTPKERARSSFNQKTLTPPGPWG